MLIKSRINFSFKKKVSLITSLGLSLWIMGIVITPLLAASEGIFWQKVASFMYFFYQPVCHQMPERSFLLYGFTMTVCVRCLCFYMGGLIITSLYTFKDNIQMWKLSFYSLLATPVVLDFLFEKLDIYTNIVGLRIITGFLLGIALFHLLLVSLSTNNTKRSNYSTEKLTVETQ